MPTNLLKEKGFSLIQIILLISVGVIILGGVIGGIVYYSKKSTEHPAVDQGRCGDGVCGPIEKSDPNACPQDCNAYDNNQSLNQQQPDDKTTVQQATQQSNNNIAFGDQVSVFVAVHMEAGAQTSDLQYQKTMWPSLVGLVVAADKYGVKLTLELNPQWAEYILQDNAKLTKVRGWEVKGHEIALHHHGPSHGDWNGYTNRVGKQNDPKYRGTIEDMMAMMNKLPVTGQILTEGGTDRETDWPDGVIYKTEGGGKKSDLISQPQDETWNGEKVTSLSYMQYATGASIALTLTEIRSALDSLEENEVMGIVFHEKDYKDRPTEIEDLFTLLQEKKIQVQTVSQILTGTQAGSNPTQQSNKNITFIENLKYSSINSSAVILDMYFPDKTCSGKLPLVIMIHGGAFRGGDKSPIKTDYLTNECYAVASVNYRLSGEALFPAGNQDVKSAVRWLRANAGTYNLDAEHFGAIGGSAGGYFSSFLGVTGDIKDFDVGDNLGYSSAVQAVVDEFGPVDFSTLAQDRVDAKLATDSAESNYIGCDISSATCENATKASPANYISKEDAPFFILHGEKDKTIPIDQSRDFYQKLQNAGVSASFIAIPNAGHGGPEFNNYESQIVEFFDKYLKK